MGGAVLLKRYRVRVAVVYPGKVATTLLFVGFAGLLLNWPLVPGLGWWTPPGCRVSNGGPVLVGHLVRIRGARARAPASLPTTTVPLRAAARRQARSRKDAQPESRSRWRVAARTRQSARRAARGPEPAASLLGEPRIPRETPSALPAAAASAPPRSHPPPPGGRAATRRRSRSRVGPQAAAGPRARQAAPRRRTTGRATLASRDEEPRASVCRRPVRRACSGPRRELLVRARGSRRVRAAAAAPSARCRIAPRRGRRGAALLVSGAGQDGAVNGVTEAYPGVRVGQVDVVRQDGRGDARARGAGLRRAPRGGLRHHLRERRRRARIADEDGQAERTRRWPNSAPWRRRGRPSSCGRPTRPRSGPCFPPSSWSTRPSRWGARTAGWARVSRRSSAAGRRGAGRLRRGAALEELAADIDATVGDPRVDYGIAVDAGQARVTEGHDGSMVDRAAFARELDRALPREPRTVRARS